MCIRDRSYMGVDALHMYDVYTPIVADADAEISYDEAKANVLEALAVLGKDYTDCLLYTSGVPAVQRLFQ